jgi:hypothetical protein
MVSLRRDEASGLDSQPSINTIEYKTLNCEAVSIRQSALGKIF